MAQHHFITTDDEEDAITSLRLEENAKRESADPPLPPFADNGAFVEFTVRAQLAARVQSHVDRKLNPVADRYRTDAAFRRQVDAILAEAVRGSDGRSRVGE